jgi:hypothetical protein
MQRLQGPLKRPSNLKPGPVSLRDTPAAIRRARKTWTLKWADAYDRVVALIEAGHCSNRAYIKQSNGKWAYADQPIVDLLYFQQQFVQNQFDMVYILQARAAAGAAAGASSRYRDVAFLLAARADGVDAADGLYLDIVCAERGYGQSILKAFLEAHAAQDIRLSALPTVIGLYSRPEFGFEYRAGCSRSDKPFKPKAALLKAVRSATRNEDPKKRPDTVQKAFADVSTASLMQQLQYHGLNVNRSTAGCRASAAAAAPSSWGNLRQAKALLDRGCAVDGYTMYRCRSK